VGTFGAVRDFVRRQSTALIDGDFPWGAVISTPSRYGASQQRLIVYPPGLTKRERRWLRMWRGWAIWGGLLWFVSQVNLIQVVNLWHALAISTGLCLVSGLTAFVMTGETRSRVRTFDAYVVAGAGDPVQLSGQRKLRLLATTLTTAHAQHLRGELSAVDYERVWWQVYDAMAPASDTMAR
jgi:Family of unknown function (DUF6611)